jgi:hypothetical protein
MPLKRAGSVVLEFDPNAVTIGGTDIRNQLSGIAVDADRMWLACDEGCRLEGLTKAGSGKAFGSHQVAPLEQLIDLPAAPNEEADVEGMFVDDGWLWLVGSHSVKRKKPKPGDTAAKIASKLEETSRDGNRHLLARVPIAGGALTRTDGPRQAAWIETSPTSSALLRAIESSGPGSARDRHLADFVPLPGKDNGFDIEGLAARGSRVWVGLRGPVLREWCCVLELAFEAGGNTLRLVKTADGALYRKHFLHLKGLGVRDLVVIDDDLLILTGPTMAHDGPSGIWRWKNGAKPGVTPSPDDVSLVGELPQASGVDKAEGLAVLERDGEKVSVMVAFDSPSPERLVDPSSVQADVYQLS